MDTAEILQFLRENKLMLEKNMGVDSIGLFGSHAKGTAGPDSDIDIFVEMPPDFSNLMRLQQYLEIHLGRPVDILRNGPHLRPNFLKSIQPDIIYA